jgi:hypothetical protein
MILHHSYSAPETALKDDDRLQKVPSGDRGGDWMLPLSAAGQVLGLLTGQTKGTPNCRKSSSCHRYSCNPWHRIRANLK